jgi:hypothetical protein
VADLQAAGSDVVLLPSCWASSPQKLARPTFQILYIVVKADRRVVVLN